MLSRWNLTTRLSLIIITAASSGMLGTVWYAAHLARAEAGYQTMNYAAELGQHHAVRVQKALIGRLDMFKAQWEGFLQAEKDLWPQLESTAEEDIVSSLQPMADLLRNNNSMIFSLWLASGKDAARMVALGGQQASPALIEKRREFVRQLSSTTSQALSGPQCMRSKMDAPSEAAKQPGSVCLFAVIRLSDQLWAGMDLDPAFLNNLTNPVAILEKGYISLISNDLKYVAHPKSERLGQAFIETDPWAEPFLKAIEAGTGFQTESFSRTSQVFVTRLCVPVDIEGWGDPLALLASIPQKKVTERADALFRKVLLSGALALALLCVVIWNVTSSLGKPLRRVVAGVGGGARRVAEATSRILQASHFLREHTDMQSSQLSAMEEGLQELDSSTRIVTDKAAEAHGALEQSRSAATKAGRTMQKLSQVMGDLYQAGEMTQKVVKTIDDIAFQTNILALNAAVEAARAGDQGAGFAVVAEEVRALALRSSNASRETAELIHRSTSGMQESQVILEDVLSELNEFSTLCDESTRRMTHIQQAMIGQHHNLQNVISGLKELRQAALREDASARDNEASGVAVTKEAEQMQALMRALTTLVEGSAASQA